MKAGTPLLPSLQSGGLRSWFFITGRLLAVVLLYVSVGELGIYFGGPESTSAFPPAGIAIGAPLILGYWCWPGVLVGAWIHGWSMGGVDPVYIIAVAVGNTLEGLAGAWLIRRFARGVRFTETPEDIVLFTLLAGVCTPLLSPPFGVPGVHLDSLAFWQHDASTLVVWWLGEVTSIVVLVPAMVLFLCPRALPVPRGGVYECLLLFGMLILISGAVFTTMPPEWAQSYLLPYLCVPFPLWAALRFGPRVTVLATSCQAIIALWATLNGKGIYAGTVPYKALMVYQGFTAVNSVFGLIVASVATERRLSREALKGTSVVLDRMMIQGGRTLPEERSVPPSQGTEPRATANRPGGRTRELSRFMESLENELEQHRQVELALTQMPQRIIEARDGERRRIAQELHDQLGQTLAALKIGLKLNSERSASAGGAAEALRPMELLVNQLIGDVHRLAWELRPPAIDVRGLPDALDAYIRQWASMTGLTVDFHSSLPDGMRLPPEVETAFYRVTQEGLTNVLKHASASRVSVLLDRRDGEVSLIIEDDGRGFEPGGARRPAGPGGGMGLAGIQERASAAGGSFQIESAPSSGTTLFVRIPLSPEPSISSSI
ncbi:MAG TPA: hypothetical protein DCM86_06080 [Verrucomicrobiales bacterium]|nr:hypothetical protein [Verrucomicrobiales bacterium]